MLSGLPLVRWWSLSKRNAGLLSIAFGKRSGRFPADIAAKGPELPNRKIICAQP
jgi:hypothetical protein